MGTVDKFFDSDKKSNDWKNDPPDFFELKYLYEGQGYGDEGWKIYRINVIVEFIWDENEGIYEINYYVSSPDGVTDVDIPDYEQFEIDVNVDLQNLGINPSYIPEMDEWNFYSK